MHPVCSKVCGGILDSSSDRFQGHRERTIEIVEINETN